MKSFCVLLYSVSFYFVRNLNIRIDKSAFNAESIGDKLKQQEKLYLYMFEFDPAVGLT